MARPCRYFLQPSRRTARTERVQDQGSDAAVLNRERRFPAYRGSRRGFRQHQAGRMPQPHQAVLVCRENGHRCQGTSLGGTSLTLSSTLSRLAIKHPTLPSRKRPSTCSSLPRRPTTFPWLCKSRQSTVSSTSLQNSASFTSTTSSLVSAST